jgi:hypothetical protein
MQKNWVIVSFMKNGIIYIGVIKFLCILSTFVDKGEIRYNNRSEYNVAGHLFHENSCREVVLFLCVHEVTFMSVPSNCMTFLTKECIRKACVLHHTALQWQSCSLFMNINCYFWINTELLNLGGRGKEGVNTIPITDTVHDTIKNWFKTCTISCRCRWY